jgi:hypothetical protein
LKRFEEEGYCEEETLENEHVEENNAEELVQLVGFEEEGSARRRLCGMNMRRMMLKSLFSWWILKRHSLRRLWILNMWRRTMLRSLLSWQILRRGSVRRRHWRMNMWRRTMLRRLWRMMLKRLCRWCIFGRRGSLWRILRWRSKSDSAG